MVSLIISLFMCKANFQNHTKELIVTDKSLSSSALWTE